MTNEKPKKDANEMTDEELITSVFPPHVVERIRREHHLDDDGRKQPEVKDERLT